jgi:head-tail adaptor
LSRPVFKAGDLNCRISVQRRSDTPDGFGNVKGALSTVGSDIPARVTPMKGGEQVKATRLQAIRNFEIVTRSDSFTRAITASDQITNQRSGETYNIRHVANLDERDQWLVFTVVAT